MEKTGLNLKEIKSRNLSSILYLLNSDSNLSRKDIAERLSLTPAAVTKLCSELIELGLIEESGEEQNTAKVGRKRIKLSLTLSKFYVLCINAEVDRITVSVACLNGDLVKSIELDVTNDCEKIINTAQRLVDEADFPKEFLICTSICVIGKVDDNRLGLWDNTRLKAIAEEIIGIPVIMENNIQAFAIAELIFGKENYDSNVLLLKWGPGVASAILNNGELLSGGNSDVTEIGHYIIKKDGKKCRCGRYGCLETEASTMEIISELDNKYSLNEIINSEDIAVKSVIDTKIDLVALALTNTATILHSGKIILFGSLFNFSYVTKKLATQCKRYNNNFDKDTIALSKLNDKISYIGPVALAAKTFFFDIKAQDK